jgi:hypothetical protein
MNESGNKNRDNTKKKSSVEISRFAEIMQESAEENLQNLEQLFAPYKKAVCFYGL